MDYLSGTTRFILGLGTTIVLFLSTTLVQGQIQPLDSTRLDSVYRPRYQPNFRPSDRYGDPFSNYTTQSPLFLKDPKNLSIEVLPDTGRTFTIYERFGPINFRSPSYMTFDEINQYHNQSTLKGYWKSKGQAMDGESAVSSRNLLPKLYTSPIFDRIFGGSYVELIPRGFVTLDFGGQWQQIQNPAIPIRQQTNGGFEFDQQINLSVTGKVGEKLKITTNFDNNNSFDFQNQMKVEYTGFKEDILKKLEIGNVSLPLNNSLITGAQNLFGIKGQFQFGKLFATAIATTQRGKQSSISINGSTDGAAQGRPFEIVGSNYDENRHFFLGQFFRDKFETWLNTLPQILSGVNIVRVEVYLLNRQNDTQTLRDVVGLMDLGESDKAYRKDYYTTVVPDGSPTDNNNNNLYSLVNQLPLASDGIDQQLQNLFGGEAAGRPFLPGTDFETITSARKLQPTEFSFNKELGYITLQRKLQNDEAIAVAFEYSYNGRNYKVGELSEDYANKGQKEVIFLKMLRPRKIAVRDNMGTILPTWHLMMKNIYNLNVTQLQRDGFQLRVIYRDDRTGIDNPQLQDGDVARTKQLIEVLGLDRLNPSMDPQPDGNFDYVEKVTINPETGLIIFPILEPFNTALRRLFAQEPNPNTQELLVQKYVFDTLYRTAKAEAELVATKNKFYIMGSFKAGAGKDIIIQGFNISPGSVKVYAGGTPLREQVDYTVDYTFGKVTILNEGILSSGKTINITYEQQDPFAFQTRSLLGTRLDYKLNEDVNLGGTLLYYNERPLITRNLIGNEPAANYQYGLDVNLRKNSRLLTKLVDALPFLQTKEQSSFTLNTEFAQLLPGTSSIVEGDGTSFIDDFENTATPYSLLNPVGWKLAHTPADPRFDLSSIAGNRDDLGAGYRRALLAWYQIDNLFYRESSQFKPDNITASDLENHYVRPILPQEIFPFRDPYVGNFYEQILDLAFYPSERGPYNFNPDLNPDGTLKTPENNWAGITTAIRTEVDFDKSNVEYAEFWLMDPFINNPNGVIDDGINEPKPNTTGGKLIFHLGSISEDLMRDGRHAFENGLPTDGNFATGVAQNNWGVVTTQQYLNNAFNNDPNARINQDVGLDGVGNDREPAIFQNFIDQVNSSSRPIVLQDPSADDFQYFLGSDLDARNAKILERYKRINGVENNSPILNRNDPFAQSGSNIPENEDLNQDNTLSELEEYYIYTLDLKPGQIDVGQKYIVDKITPEGLNDVTWYLVRIPIRQFEDKFGGINGFKSIRYARMILTGFKEPVVLRFSNFRAVGNRWRRYTARLAQSNFSEELEPNLDNFSVSVVNVEENGKGNAEKPAYVPPLARDRDITSTIQRRLNEQSVQMCVTNLEDGDARAIFKNVSFDFFNYGRIKMFLSAHGNGLQDNQLTAFLRLGTDFDQNYYEIQLPLKITPNGNDPNPDVIWPEQNQIDLDLNELYALKAARDREKYPLNQLYPLAGPKAIDRHGIRIFGRPDLSQVKLMMIGIVNPRDDASPLSVCMWANEMRLTDFDRTAGWAVNGVLNAKLADLGNVSSSIRHTTFGFGGVQSKISERTRGTTTSFDVSANIMVDKLLPRNTGLKIPMFVSYEQTTFDPNFDPANPDTRIAAMKKSFNTDQERDDYLAIIQDNAIRRSINFTNVRKTKVKPDARSNLYDIENFSFTYAYSEATRTNFNLIENTQRNIKGAVAWQFNSSFKGFDPLAKMPWKSPWLGLIKDINFNPVPTSISVRGELDRAFNKIVYRNYLENASTPPNLQKSFLFNRFFNVHWNLAKSLTLDYSSRVNAIIDEPDVDPGGGYSAKLGRYITAEEYRDSVRTNLQNFGRKRNFEQTITANYTVPFDKLPLTDWVGLEYRYNVGYFWRTGPVERYDSLKLGNIIQNNRDQGFNGRIDLIKLYNKVGYLKKINTPQRKPTATEKAKAKPDTLKSPPNYAAVNAFLRLLMSMRSITGTYNITQGTILTGFTGTPDVMGFDNTLDAPGWGFILGSQDPNIRFRAAENGWLTKAANLTSPFAQNDTRELAIRTALELTTDFKIQLDVKKSTTSSFQEIFRFDPSMDDYVELSPNRTGSYRISTIAIGTTFENNESLTSTVFKQFENNISTIKQRFNAVTGNGYETQSQDVLIPAFIAAYTGRDANNIGLSPFPSTPLPNWRVDYTGLSKAGFLKDAFQSISITHAYSSTYSVSNFTSSLEYSDITNNIPLSDYNDSFFATERNSKQQLIPVFVISQVMISEQFAPLFGISVRTKSKLTARLEYKTKRDLSLNVSNAQITEVNAKDWSLEVGYIKNNLKLPWKSQGRVVTLKNEINFRLNISVTNNQTIQRKIDEVNTITNGNINIQVRPNVSYTVNSKLNVQFYVDSNVNEPLVSNSFPRSTTRVGLKVLFNLSQ